MNLRWPGGCGLLLIGLVVGCDGGAGQSQPKSADDKATVGTAAVAMATAESAPSAPPATQVIALPGTPPGVGFDDLRFVAFPDSFSAILAPAGRTGNVDFIDPASGKVTSLGGFSVDGAFGGGHDFGVTSADGGFDGLFALDRTSKKLHLADPIKKQIVGSVGLAASPDYVRYFMPFRQAWVTEPDAEQIEVFDMPKVGTMDAAFVGGGAPVKSATITVKGGPESLVFDVKRSRAYSNLWTRSTVSIDMSENKVVATWPNGCQKSRGIDLHEDILFVGCAEGKVSALDAASGKLLGSLETKGEGVDILAFAPGLRHVYVPSSKAGSVAVVGVTAKGELSLLGSLPAAVGAHCVAADKNGYAYVCDPQRGAILKIKDPYPATR